MIQIAICDDNIDELSNMTQLINQYISEKHIYMEYIAFTNGFELISALEKGRRFDLYCLDIIMPSFTGIDCAKEIRRFDKDTPLIFFTSSSEFALESFSVKAINYVLKPVSKEKLFFTLDDVLEHMRIEEDAAIIVKSSEGVQRILVNNLVFAEVIGRTVFYHLVSGKVIECIEAFSSTCDSLLKYRCFIRTHRSYILNMQYIDTISNSHVTLQTLTSIPIAQGKARIIKQQYLAFQMEEE